VTANCATHGDYQARQRTIAGNVFTDRCPKCTAEENAEKDQKQKAKRAEYIKSIREQANIPARFRDRTFRNYRADSKEQETALEIARTYALRFEDLLGHGAGLVFCGKPGTGKTHLAVAIARMVLSKGRTVLFAPVIEALRQVKETYGRNSSMSESQAINRFVKPTLLILDDVGVQYGSEAEKLILYEILDARYRNARPTIMTSNLTQEELIDYVGTRNLDRMKEGGGAVVAFTWDSYRQRVHRDERLAPVPVARTPMQDDDGQGEQ